MGKGLECVMGRSDSHQSVKVDLSSRSGKQSSGFNHFYIADGCKAIFTLVTLGLLASCGDTSGSDPSILKHTLGQPTVAGRSAEYLEVNQSILDEQDGPSGERYLDTDHRLTKIVQGWVDHIDQVLRTDHPELLTGVPKPYVQVKLSPGAGAFVRSVNACHDYYVVLPEQESTPSDEVLASRSHGDRLKGDDANDNQANQPGASSRGLTPWSTSLGSSPTPTLSGVKQSNSSTLETVYFSGVGGHFTEALPNQACVAGSDSDEEIQAFADQYNQSSRGCQLDVVPVAGRTDILRASSQCTRSDSLDGAKSARRMIFRKTANVVTVFSGLLDQLDQKEALSVVAHELAHYYRSHPSQAHKELGFYYTMSERNPAERPLPDPELDELGTRAFISSILRRSYESVARFDDQLVRSELFEANGSVIQDMCNGPGCPEECQVAQQLQEEEWFKKSALDFPHKGGDDSAGIGKFEMAALSCFAKIKVQPGLEKIGNGQVSWEQYLELVGQPSWRVWRPLISLNDLKNRLGLHQLANKRLSMFVPKGENLLAVVLEASVLLDLQDNSQLAVLQEVLDKKLGWYTQEQEADDLALEILASINIDPQVHAAALAKIGSEEKTRLGGFEIGMQECLKLWQSNWRDDQGNPVPVPLGDFQRVHHSMCYRVYNIVREIETHQYQQRPSSAVDLTEETAYRKLVDMAVNESRQGRWMRRLPVLPPVPIDGLAGPSLSELNRSLEQELHANCDHGSATAEQRWVFGTSD